MEKIIDPIDVKLLEAELTPDRKLCDTNKADNEIYVFDGRECPNLLMEVGRLRELAFREAGGCSGLSMDLDVFDTMENPYKQIIIWDPDAKAIIGGYRYILGPDVVLREDGQPFITSAHLYHFSDKFIRDYLPHAMELGRSFVAPEYQSSKAGAKAIYALDNLWDGIASVTMQHPGIVYFFGKMTIHPGYDKSCFALINHFLWKHFGDYEELVRPYRSVELSVDSRLLDLILDSDDFKDDYRKLKAAIRHFGLSIPPLVNSYMNVSPTMKMFGSTYNDELAEAIETGIMVCFDEMHADKLDRHIEPYFKNLAARIGRRFPRIEKGSKVSLIDRIMLRKKEKRARRAEKFKEKMK